MDFLPLGLFRVGWLTACVCESYGCKMDEDIEAVTAFSKEFGDMPQLLTE